MPHSRWLLASLALVITSVLVVEAGIAATEVGWGPLHELLYELLCELLWGKRR